MAVSKIITEKTLKQALETSSVTRQQAVSLCDFVANLPPAPPSAETLLQISKQQKVLIANLALLRGLHRDAHIGARETKALTAEARQEVDRLHLQLQNLYYEQQHLAGEIEACESYEYIHCSLPPPSSADDHLATNISNSRSSPSQTSSPAAPSSQMQTRIR